ncbi:MAG: MATE family efflux transporter, partial [Halapricum sp.]
MLKPLVLLSLPIIVSQLMQVGYNLADTFWVGRLGQDAVTALSLSLPFVFLMISLGSGLTVAGTVLVSQNTGAGKTDRVGHVAGQTITFVSLVSLGLAALGFFLAPILLPLIGTTPGTAVNRLAIEYTRTVFVGVIFMFGFFIFQALLRGYGDTVTPMNLMGASVFLNVVLDPFLVLGFQHNPVFEWLQALPVGIDFLAMQAHLYASTGFTGMGVQGAAIATVFSRGVAAAIGMAM